ncbi:MAG: LemA family protein, partial [Dehalococcoidia bacterium]|nr:LemA family protein [Dehalococcoidia bacterium]
MIVVIGVIVGVVVVLGIIFWAVYNSLVRLRNQVRNSWSQIDVQLKRRHDLIPNLMETVKGYMKHERETLEAVTKARTSAVEASGKGVGQQAKAEGALSEMLTRFFAVAENYPDLKANQNFLALQEELTSTENKVSFARQFY